MRVLQINSYGLGSLSSLSSLNNNFNNNNAKYLTNINIAKRFTTLLSPNISINCRGKFRITVASANEKSNSESVAPNEEEEEPGVKFAFVHSVLFPDGTPDVQYRKAVGGQKLRDIMLEAHVELYGPYSRPLLNCGGGGTCGTCMVEAVEGKQLLSPRTEIEKEKLKRKPKNWRLACQTTVGTPDSKGTVVIQQLPEWKSHEWNYKKLKSEEGEAWSELRLST